VQFFFILGSGGDFYLMTVDVVTQQVNEMEHIVILFQKVEHEK